MSSTIETLILNRVEELLTAIEEIKRVLVEQFAPVRREGLPMPITGIYFEEQDVDNRNRVDAVTGILHIETVWFVPEGQQFKRKEAAQIKHLINAALFDDSTLLEYVKKFERLPSRYELPFDDMVYLVTDYRLTYFHKRGDMTTKQYQQS